MTRPASQELDHRTVKTLLGAELRQLRRSGRTILISIVLPMFVVPLMLFLQTAAASDQAERVASGTYRYAVLGPEAPVATTWIEHALAQQEPSDEGATFERIEVSGDALTAFEADEIDFWLEATTGPLSDEADASSPEDESSAESEDLEAGEAAADSALVLTLFVRGDIEASEAGSRILKERLEAARIERRFALMRERDYGIEPSLLATLETLDVASASEASGLRLGRFLPALLLMLMLSGGSVVAMDSIAGEKERGTLETLLTTAATRLEIVVSKSLAILIVALVITALQVGNLLIWVGAELLPLPEGFQLPLDLGNAVLLLILFLPLAVLVSSVLLMVSARARSYKEAQLLFFPVMVILVLPALVVVLPALVLRSAMVLVPIANISLAVKELLAGTPDWPMMTLAWSINVIFAGVIARASIGALSSERLLSATSFDEADLRGGVKLFARHATRWFAVLWSVFLVWQLSVPAATDIRVVLVVNMALFVGVSILLMRRYHMPARRTLLWRAPRLVVWPLTLLGAPAALIATASVSNLYAEFLDIPDSWAEQMTRGMLSDQLSTATLLFFFALLPGVCEEVAFRGVLLHGLRQRLGPLATCLLVGAIFGLFHISLPRLLPTALLGFLLAALTLMTQSLWPAIVWHVINNATAILLDRYGESYLTSDAGWPIAAAYLVLAGCLVLLWRTRRQDTSVVATG